MAAAGEEVAGSPSAVEGSRRAAGGRAAGHIVRIGREEGCAECVVSSRAEEMGTRAGLSLSMLSLTMLAADIEDRHRSSLGLPLLLSSGWVGW